MKDHKMMYGIYLRAGLFSSVMIFIMLFLLVPYAAPEPYTLKREIVTMVEAISAHIERLEDPPPIERPHVAVAAGKDAGDDVVETIPVTVFREDPLRPVPTGPEIEIVPYYKVEVKPKPVYNAIPEYPELARKAGIEGVTVVKMLVDIDGSITEVIILKSSGNHMLDEAALVAARKSKFTPARQRDRFVRVWVARQMQFRLN